MGNLNDLKAEVMKMNGEVGSMVKKLNERFCSLWVNVRTAHSNGLGRLLASPAGKSLDARAKTIGHGVHHLKLASATAVSSSVCGMLEDFKTLRANVDRNVHALKSGGGGEGMNHSQQPTLPSPSPAVAELCRNVGRNNQALRSGRGGKGLSNSEQPTSLAASPSPAAAAELSPMVSFPASKRDMLAGVASPQTGPQSFQEPSSSSEPSTSAISFSDEVSEEDPHPDMSTVSATSVFSIGYVGPPLLGPQELGSFVLDSNEVRGVPLIETDTAQEVSGPAPAVKLEDVRKSIGKALVVYKKIRALGFRESSWENKMPWHNPRPTSLAKGLKWPRQKFSSVRERHEYHRQARRRGRYLIGPTPGWSWFAADIVFLYFLINNPAGNFLI